MTYHTPLSSFDSSFALAQPAQAPVADATRRQTRAELANPGVPGYMYYDPERPSDHPDEIIRVQRQRTRDASANEARREAMRRRLAATELPEAVN